MINRNNKKGFTIVELVIVIAVIAILAAVLIPTFSGIIAKANESADIKAVREMNTALAAEFAAEKPAEDDMNAVIDALSKNGFNSNKALIPVSKDYEFAWSWADCRVVLINDKDEIIFPEGITATASECKALEIKYLDVVANDVATFEDALITGNENITLESNIELKTEITLPKDSNVTIDLNNKTLTTAQSGTSAESYRSKYLNVGEGSTLTITNGTIKARGIQVLKGGKLIIEESANVIVKSVDNNGGAAVWIDGGEVEINGGTFVVEGTPISETRGATVVYNDGGKLTINGGKFESIAGKGPYAIQTAKGGTTIINGGEFTADRGCVAVQTGGKVTINGGKFTSNWTGGSAYVFAASSSDCEITLAQNIEIVASNIEHEVWIEEGSTFTNNSNLTFTQNGEYYDLAN